MRPIRIQQSTPVTSYLKPNEVAVEPSHPAKCTKPSKNHRKRTLRSRCKLNLTYKIVCNHRTTRHATSLQCPCSFRACHCNSSRNSKGKGWRQKVFYTPVRYFLVATYSYIEYLKFQLKQKIFEEGGWLRLNLHTNTKFQDLKQLCKVLNSTAIASGYAGRDPQGGTSDGSFLSKFSFMLPLMVKNSSFSSLNGKWKWS